MNTILKIYKGFVAWASQKWKQHKARPAALRRAVKKADRLGKRINKRYKVYFIQNRYQALTRADVQAKKHADEFNPNINVTRMQPLAFYDTATGLPDFAAKLLGTRNFKL